MSEEWVAIVAIAGGISFAAYSVYLRARMRELAHRERLAMIERGLVPPPESDPGRFERMMGLTAGEDYTRWRIQRGRRAGIMLIGVGLGLMLLIGMTSRRLEVGLGVGGMLMMLGLALFVNAMFDARASGQAPSEKGSGTTPSDPRPSA